MYKIETIQKMMKKAMETKKFYMAKDAKDIDICISKGNQKIGKVMNISLMPIMTCGNCKECKYLCYDVKACIQYKNVIDARIRNTVLLEKDRKEYFDRIEKAIQKRKSNKYFRWHVAGDIIDLDYFENMVLIAKRHPDFIFWTYTKQYNIVNTFCEKYGKDEIPNNLKVMFSEWRGMAMINPFRFPEFRVVFKDEVKPIGFYCLGNCDKCKENNSGCIKGETTYCLEH